MNGNEKVRLNKFIASTGLYSRRKADELIEAGKVKVNGEIVRDFSTTVNRKDKITVNDKPIEVNKEFTYIKYYKPAGYITTKSDEKNRKTIYDILPPEVQHLKPVGRLDKDSTGLLILTDDGDLINKMTHPSIKIPKVYRVCVEGLIEQNDLIRWAKGLEIQKGKIAYAEASVEDIEDGNTVLTVVLRQGMNRQIRKMAEAVKHPVISLKRTHHGCVDLLGLKKGAFKYLKPTQIKELKNYIAKIEKEYKK
ncbi:MAG: rRNA pseudouridine synthase [Candidatus Gastranaerophilales bacterium]|nr:rRNA pseudouridine synthase [Candidatus Gastranaerophilales bacterium]